MKYGMMTSAVVVAVLTLGIAGCGKQESAAPTAPPVAESALQQVESTTFSAVGYNEATRELSVVFRDGGETYVYANVPPAAYKEMMEADSVGGYFHANIKDNFEYTKE